MRTPQFVTCSFLFDNDQEKYKSFPQLMFIIMTLHVFLYPTVCIINYKTPNDLHPIKYKPKSLYFFTPDCKSQGSFFPR